jgi:predicted alpha/beta hydrolase family esterase
MKDDLRTTTQKLQDGAEFFETTLIEAEQPSCVVLFAVGRGGNPLRHCALLRFIAGLGCTIVAPHLDMLASSIPSGVDLDRRIRRLDASVDEYARTDLPLVGIGHSIGCVALLALAGGKAETLAGDRITSGSKWKFARLALLAPPTDFFRRPGALSQVKTPIQVWAGAKDQVTPPSQALFLKEALETQVPIEVCIDDEAGHFTYMNDLPPNATDPHPDRSVFLASLADDIGQFVRGA